MSDILDLIDQAIDDCAVSGDAMRWAPDAPGRLHISIDRIASIFDVPIEILLDDRGQVIGWDRLDMPAGMQFALYGNAYVRAPRRGED